MESETTRRFAVSCMQDGLNCAEAVFLAVGRHFGGEGRGLPSRLATCFGGGLGRTHEELCGALAGGVMALGDICGRDRRGQNWDAAADLARTLRERFVERFRASRCRSVLDALGPQENMDKCRSLTGDAAVLVLEVLAEAGMTPQS